MPRTSWSARGIPVMRRTAAAPAADQRPTSSRATPALPPLPGTAPSTAELVRQCLLRPPQPGSLHVGQPGLPEGRQLRRARAAHRLEPWEELIAVWQWAPVLGMFSATPSGLIFTGDGIRIAEPRLSLTLAYGAFCDYTFSYAFTPGGRGGPDLCELVIAGPTPWRSPNADQDAELLAADLTRIKELLAAPRG